MFKAWLEDEATARGFFKYAAQYGYKWSDGTRATPTDYKTFPGVIYVVVRNGVITWGSNRKEYLEIDAPFYIERIRQLLPIAAQLEQLAEECSEAAKEALKAARILRDENPTPENYEIVMGRLENELNDISNAADVLQVYALGDPAKMFRWCMRLETNEC